MEIIYRIENLKNVKEKEILGTIKQFLSGNLR